MITSEALPAGETEGVLRYTYMSRYYVYILVRTYS